MTQESAGGRVATWVTVVTISAPVLSAVVVALLTQRTSLHLAELESAAKQTQIGIEQAKLREQQETRRQQFMVEHLPKLLSANPTERSLGRALLFLNFPSEASDIVQQLIPAAPDAVRQSLEAVKRDAGEVQSQTGDWTVVVSGDKAVAPAKYEVERATRLGYKPVSLYLRDGFYRTTVGNYPTSQLAEQAALAVRSEIRSDAYVVALGRWCPRFEARTEAGLQVQVCSSTK